MQNKKKHINLVIVVIFVKMNDFEDISTEHWSDSVENRCNIVFSPTQLHELDIIVSRLAPQIVKDIPIVKRWIKEQIIG